MATHSSILAWKIPWTEEPVDYSPWGRKESDMTEQLCIHRRVIAFLPRSKRLLISWLQSAPAVILEPRKIKSDTVSTVSPSISHEPGSWFPLNLHVIIPVTTISGTMKTVFCSYTC